MFGLVKYLVLMTVLVEWLSIDPQIAFIFYEITLVHQVLLGSCVLESARGNDEKIRLDDSEERKYQ